jgi:hypothetical protein
MASARQVIGTDRIGALRGRRHCDPDTAGPRKTRLEFPRRDPASTITPSALSWRAGGLPRLAAIAVGPETIR